MRLLQTTDSKQAARSKQAYTDFFGRHVSSKNVKHS